MKPEVIEMNGRALYVLVALSALSALPILGQSSASAPAQIGLSGCGDTRAQFQVKRVDGVNPVQPDPGKALVFFIEKDVDDATFSVPNTRVGSDGNWVGATHGDSYFYVMMSPGDHHLCSAVAFDGCRGCRTGAAVAHFTAEAGGVYYFETKNIAQRNSTATDVSLFPLDSDEGRYLVARLPLVAARQKK